MEADAELEPDADDVELDEPFEDPLDAAFPSPEDGLESLLLFAAALSALVVEEDALLPLSSELLPEPEPGLP